MRHSFVPPYLLRHLASLDGQSFAPVVAAARRSLALDETFRGVREGESVPPTTIPVPRPTMAARALEKPRRTVFDAHGEEVLPGREVRKEGDAPTGDVAVDEAYDGFGSTHALFKDVFARASVDDDNLPLLGTVHYGEGYDNAFWDGERMVFGDGDGVVFNRFTSSLSVIGHELAHGVTQFTANLVYQGQSGALNESVSDVFGALVEQYATSQSADEASWLIGVGLFTGDVQGVALRSMRAPGTAYDDDVLGRDPQPATMAGYITTKDDNGGVHLNSGIPNHAFYLAATAIGGDAWETAGRIWYDALTGGAIPATCTFAQFAKATADAAVERFGKRSAEHTAVVDAWKAVGVKAAGAKTVRV